MSALNLIIDTHHLLVEGAAAAAVAGCLAYKPGGRVVVVLCGANIGRQTLARVLRE